MAGLVILPPAAKFLKKLSDKKLKALYQKPLTISCSIHPSEMQKQVI